MKEQRKIQNQQAMTNKRASSVALESAIASFQSKNNVVQNMCACLVIV